MREILKTLEGKELSYMTRVAQHGFCPSVFVSLSLDVVYLMCS